MFVCSICFFVSCPLGLLVVRFSILFFGWAVGCLASWLLGCLAACLLGLLAG